MRARAQSAQARKTTHFHRSIGVAINLPMILQSELKVACNCHMPMVAAAAGAAAAASAAAAAYGQQTDKSQRFSRRSSMMLLAPIDRQPSMSSGSCLSRFHIVVGRVWSDKIISFAVGAHTFSAQPQQQPLISEHFPLVFAGKERSISP